MTLPAALLPCATPELVCGKSAPPPAHHPNPSAPSSNVAAAREIADSRRAGSGARDRDCPAALRPLKPHSDSCAPDTRHEYEEIARPVPGSNHKDLPIPYPMIRGGEKSLEKAENHHPQRSGEAGARCFASPPTSSPN